MKMTDVRWSDLAEDMVGFGARSLRSIWQLVANPRPYFEAAKTQDWSGFTPSFRLYIALFTLSTLLRFLYLGDSGVMTELYTTQFEAVLEQLSAEEEAFARIDAADLASDVLSRMFTWAASLLFVGYTLFGLVWGAYGEKLTAPVRVRYLYALLVPANLFMLVSTVVLALSSPGYAGYVSFGSMVVSVLIITVTAYRGAYPLALPKGERAVRAVFLGLLTVVVMMLSTVAALLIGMFGGMAEALTAARALG